MASVRGLSWKRAETLDLLTVWGQPTVHEALWESQRNRDTFEQIAQQMSALGHSRELDQILQGDGTARSQRVCNSFPLQTRPSTSSSQRTADSQAASPNEDFRLTLEPDEEQPEEEVLVP
ncbi:UNVERIFIED_CONTAM: hypothetical protein K2H54_047721, partial [Gekko kuhli]